MINSLSQNEQPLRNQGEIKIKKEKERSDGKSQRRNHQREVNNLLWKLKKVNWKNQNQINMNKKGNLLDHLIQEKGQEAQRNLIVIFGVVIRT